MNQLNKKQILSYGIGSLGEGLAYNIFYSFFIYYLNTVVGMDAAIAGTISLISVIIGAFADPIVGSLSDRFSHPLGKRTPFIIGGAIPLGISIVLLFSNLPMIPIAKIIYYFGVNVLFWVSLAITDIPYVSLGGEITSDYKLKTKLRTYATFFLNLSALFVAGAIFPIITIINRITLNEQLSWLIVSAFIGLTTTISFLISGLFFLKKEKSQTSIAPKVNFIKEFLQIIQVKQTAIVFSISALANILVGLGGGLLVYVLGFSYRLNEAEYAIVSISMTVFFILAVIPVGSLVMRFGKKATLTGCYAISIFVIMLRLFLPLTFLAAFVTQVFAGIGLCAFWVVVYTMLYDVIEIDELRFSKRRDGTIIAINSLIMKLSASIGMWIMGILFSISKVDFTDSQLLESSRMSTIHISVWTMVIGLVISIILLNFYKMNQEKYEEIIRIKKENMDVTSIVNPEILEILG
jgi:glycoside/pentoside/hexuronide:cation symporter, GPH family